MFTGLIEAVCTVKTIRESGGSAELAVDLGRLAGPVGSIGESIAVNGACLTVTALNGSIAEFDLSSETLAKSTLGGLKPASKVNVERAMAADSRFGGHFVTGHIDGTAAIKSIEKKRQFADIKFSAGSGLLDQMIVKGSVAVDGLSLTITRLDQNSFSVTLIPQTLDKTTLGKAKVGDRVNVETDMMVKTIKKQLEKILPQGQKLTVERLKELGF